MQHVKILGVRIIMRKGEIKVGIERNHLAAELLQYLSAERRLVRLLTETGSRNVFRQRRPESTASIGSFAQELLKLLATRSRIKLLHPLNQWHAESPLLTKGAQFSAPARPTNRAGLWRDP